MLRKGARAKIEDRLWRKGPRIVPTSARTAKVCANGWGRAMASSWSGVSSSPVSLRTPVSAIAVATCGVTSAIGAAVALCGGASWAAASTATASPAP